MTPEPPDMESCIPVEQFLPQVAMVNVEQLFTESQPRVLRVAFKPLVAGLDVAPKGKAE